MIESLFTIIVIELFVGGGGRLTEVGPATLRMVLFAVLLCISAHVAVVRKQTGAQTLAFALAAAYMLVHMPGLVVGALHGALPADMLSEMQQSLYFLAAPFFAQVLRVPAMVERTASLAVFAGVVLSTAYLAAVGGLATGLIDFADLYPVITETGEFFFRGEGFFFYKGFLYLGIAAVFLVAIRGRYWALLLTMILCAIVLTLTRGFALSTSIAILAMLAVQRRWRWLGFASLVTCAAAFLVWVYFPSLDEVFATQRDTSNEQRYDDINYMIEHMSATTLLWGEGFGSMINDRMNIENTFLWVLWKVGVVGVAFWCVPLALCTRFFLRVPRQGRRFRLACAYFFGTVLVYVQTLTNPYLNNPIGLSFVLISIFSLRTLSRAGRPPVSPTAVLFRRGLLHHSTSSA